MRTRQQQLVATALISALGVSGYAYYQAQGQQAATLTRIAALATCLTASNQERAQAASNTVASISERVRKNRNQAQDVAVLQQAQAILKHSTAVIDALHQLRQSWQTTGHRAEVGQLSAPLKQYIVFIEGYVPDVPTQLAAASWLGNFNAAASQPASLALLTRLETQVQQLAAEALRKQAEKIGSSCGFDKMGLFAVPAAETVAPGAVYQAQLLLALATSSGRAQFSANGQAVPLDPATGQGVVRFKVPGAHAGQPDTVRAQWRGRVQLPWAARDTVLETTVPYLILKASQR